MSSTSSELSWPSSDSEDIEILLAVESPNKAPLRHNKWTPINLQKNSLSLPPQDQNHPDPPPAESSSASHLRDVILISAKIIAHENPRPRKRRSPTTSPTNTRRKRTKIDNPDDTGDSSTPTIDKKPPPKKITRTPRKSKPITPVIEDPLIPSQPNRLNMAATRSKRSFKDAFPSLSNEQHEDAENIAEPTNTFKMTRLAAETDLVLSEIDKKAQPDLKMTGTDGEDAEDFFDNDDTFVEEFLEAEKTLLTDPDRVPEQDVMPGFYARGEPTLDDFMQAPDYPPMKPFVRPFHPLPSSQDTSPASSIVSGVHRPPVCFRIAEPLRYISSTFFSGGFPPVKFLYIDMYAKLSATNIRRETLRRVNEFTLTDIFFPDRPPYLIATATAMTASSNFHNMQGGFFTHIVGGLVYVLLRVEPKDPIGKPQFNPTTFMNHCNVMVSRVERADWDQIQRTKKICDEVSPSGPANSEIPPPNTSNADSWTKTTMLGHHLLSATADTRQRAVRATHKNLIAEFHKK